MVVENVKLGEGRFEIRGTKSALLSAASGGGAIENGEVPGFVQEWRRERDLVVTVLFAYHDNGLIL